PPSTELDPLSLHDALPICPSIYAGGCNQCYHHTLTLTLTSLLSFSPLITACVCAISPISLPSLSHLSLISFISLSHFGNLTHSQDRKSTRLNSSHVKISYA